MKARLNPGESFGLYGIILGFVFLFYVLGLFVGKNYFVEARGSSENVPVSHVPVPDLKSQLTFYDQVMDPSQPAPSPAQAPPLSEESSGASSEESAGAGESLQDQEPLAPFEIYTIQVAAMKKESEARQMMLRLEAKNYSGRLQPPEAGQDGYYRVLVGEFATQGEAQEMERRLKEESFPTFIKKIKLSRLPSTGQDDD